MISVILLTLYDWILSMLQSNSLPPLTCRSSNYIVMLWLCRSMTKNQDRFLQLEQMRMQLEMIQMWLCNHIHWQLWVTIWLILHFLFCYPPNLLRMLGLFSLIPILISTTQLSLSIYTTILLALACCPICDILYWAFLIYNLYYIYDLW